MPENELHESSLRRVEVLELRQRLDHAAACAFDASCDPEVRGKQNKIKSRLVFILRVDGGDAAFVESCSILRLARHVYARSSDVMHGRVSMLNVPQVVVDEWRAIVEELERITAGSV